MQGKAHYWYFDIFSKEVFLEICPNNVRDMATLNEIILRRVKAGTSIFTDG